jgi:hypothetical protein
MQPPYNQPPYSQPPYGPPGQQPQQPYGSGGWGQPPAAQQVYQFSYMAVTRVTAKLDAQALEARVGIRTFRAEVARLRHLYVRDSRMGNGYRELILTHEKSPGKLARIRLYADLGQPGFDALVQALVAMRPDIDIRRMDAKSAFKLMGAANTEKIALVLIAVLIPLIMGVLVLPQLIHGLDSGEDTVALAQLEQGNFPESRNVTIVGGRALLDRSVRVSTTRKGRTTVQYFVPLVSPGWQPGQPVAVVLRTGNLTASEDYALARANTFQGVIRDVMWEGLGRTERNFFTDRMSLHVADDATLVELNASPGADLLLFGVVMGITVLICGGLAVVFWVKQRAR